MLNQSFGSQPKTPYGQSFRQGGMTETNPRQILATALTQTRGANAALAPQTASPLAQAIAKKKKSKGY